MPASFTTLPPELHTEIFLAIARSPPSTAHPLLLLTTLSSLSSTCRSSHAAYLSSRNLILRTVLYTLLPHPLHRLAPMVAKIDCKADPNSLEFQLELVRNHVKMVDLARFSKARTDGVDYLEHCSSGAMQREFNDLESDIQESPSPSTPRDDSESLGPGSWQTIRTQPLEKWIVAMYAYSVFGGSLSWQKEDYLKELLGGDSEGPREDVGGDKMFQIVLNIIGDFGRVVKTGLVVNMRRLIRRGTKRVPEYEGKEGEVDWRRVWNHRLSMDMTWNMEDEPRPYWKLTGELLGAWRKEWKEWEIVPDDESIGSKARQLQRFWEKNEEEAERKWKVFMEWAWDGEEPILPDAGTYMVPESKPEEDSDVDE